MHALAKLAAPGVVFKAEAIVAPDDLVPYLGGHHAATGPSASWPTTTS